MLTGLTPDGCFVLTAAANGLVERVSDLQANDVTAHVKRGKAQSICMHVVARAQVQTKGTCRTWYACCNMHAVGNMDGGFSECIVCLVSVQPACALSWLVFWQTTVLLVVAVARALAG